MYFFPPSGSGGPAKLAPGRGEAAPLYAVLVVDLVKGAVEIL